MNSLERVPTRLPDPGIMQSHDDLVRELIFPPTASQGIVPRLLHRPPEHDGRSLHFRPLFRPDTK